VFLVEEAWIIFHEADKPDAVGGLPDTPMLAAKDGAQIDLASANADSVAPGDLYRAVVKRYSGRCDQEHQDHRFPTRYVTEFS
jgi:hypothetical protein